MSVRGQYQQSGECYKIMQQISKYGELGQFNSGE